MSVLNKALPNNKCFGLFKDVSVDWPFHERQMPSEQEEGLEVRQKKQEVDALLCQAMDSLSLEERKKQEDILHGISQAVEDAGLVNTALEDLDGQLQSIKHNSMYEVAERINPDYVSARAFRVMFLRANSYDAKASANQMLKFFDSKYQLFGIEKLVEDITLADLNEDDLKCLKSGHVQLAGRDSSGRQIIFHLSGLSGRLESWLRVQYFVKLKALEDEETQLRGIISIWSANPRFKANQTSQKVMVEGFIAANALPQKKQAIHICLDKMWQYVGSNMLIKLMKGEMRARLRVHYGSPMECQYQLAAYGIQPQSIPMDSSGKVELSRHLNWIQSCDMEDKFFRSLQPTDNAALAHHQTTIFPNRNDVLFTGGKIMNHLGNQRFHSILQSYAEVYNQGTDETKRQIAASVTQKIQESGGRFLARQQVDEGTTSWKEVSSDELKKKIMQAFRNRRRMVDASKKKPGDGVNGTLIAGEPLPNDVIFGRGRRNPGSQLLHRLIKEHSNGYESLGRGNKIGLVETLMQTIKDHDGRFLVKVAGEPERWAELSHNNARDRISKTFQNNRRPSTKGINK